ncbi:hypothetical protein RUM43_009047 [Polyplax serrata]|uniref:LAGLIDADG homing endonuclease n=1 Tax=Polyplax serrata TaxID=468196 RepID=A0AAN8S493_POLSC
MGWIQPFYLAAFVSTLLWTTVSPMSTSKFYFETRQNIGSVAVMCRPNRTAVFGHLLQASGTQGVKINNTFQASLKTSFFNISKPVIKEQVISWVDSVVEVLEKNLPGEYWYHTTMSLLINDPLIKYDRDILEVVLLCMREWGFHVLNVKHLIYYEGSMKGVLTWFAVNLLSENITNPAPVVGLTDKADNIILPRLKEGKILPVTSRSLYKVKFNGKPANYYLDSERSSLGLQKVRRKVLKPLNKTGRILMSACMPENFTTHWMYKGVNYTVEGTYSKSTVHTTVVYASTSKQRRKSRGSELLSVKYKDCKKAVVGMLSRFGKNYTLGPRKMWALSDLQKIAENASLISNSVREVTVRKTMNRTMEVCSHFDPSKPFSCLDMTFLCVFFRVHFGLHKNATIAFLDSKLNYKVNWHLGLALYTAYAKPLLNTEIKKIVLQKK